MNPYAEDGNEAGASPPEHPHDEDPNQSHVIADGSGAPGSDTDNDRGGREGEVNYGKADTSNVEVGDPVEINGQLFVVVQKDANNGDIHVQPAYGPNGEINVPGNGLGGGGGGGGGGAANEAGGGPGGNAGPGSGGNEPYEPERGPSSGGGELIGDRGGDRHDGESPERPEPMHVRDHDGLDTPGSGRGSGTGTNAGTIRGAGNNSPEGSRGKNGKIPPGIGLPKGTDPRNAPGRDGGMGLLDVPGIDKTSAFGRGLVKGALAGIVIGAGITLIPGLSLVALGAGIYAAVKKRDEILGNLERLATGTSTPEDWEARGEFLGGVVGGGVAGKGLGGGRVNPAAAEEGMATEEAAAAAEEAAAAAEEATAATEVAAPKGNTPATSDVPQSGVKGGNTGAGPGGSEPGGQPAPLPAPPEPPPTMDVPPAPNANAKGAPYLNKVYKIKARDNATGDEYLFKTGITGPKSGNFNARPQSQVNRLNKNSSMEFFYEWVTDTPVSREAALLIEKAQVTMTIEDGMFMPGQMLPRPFPRP